LPIRAPLSAPCVIYVAIGFLAARGAAVSPIATAATTASLVGLVEASAGWAVSWIIGPGRPPNGISLTLKRWIVAAVFVAALAAVCGVVGGFSGRPPPSGVAAV